MGRQGRAAPRTREAMFSSVKESGEGDKTTFSLILQVFQHSLLLLGRRVSALTWPDQDCYGPVEAKGRNIYRIWPTTSGFSIISPFPYMFVFGVCRGACQRTN